MTLKILKNPVEFLNLIEDSKETFLIVKKEKVIDMEFFFRIIHNLKATFSKFHAVNIVEKVHSLEEALDKYRDETFFVEEFPEDLRSSLENCENYFKIFMRGHAELIEMANREAQSKETEDTIFIPSVTHFIIDNFGDDSIFYKKFKENFLWGRLSEKLKKYEYLVVELSNSQGKIISYEVEDMAFIVNTPPYKGILNSCLHLLRNSIDHGIETPEEREELDKIKKEKSKFLLKKQD